MNSIEFGAKQAVENCVNVQPNETVVIITDKQTEYLANALEEAAKKITDKVKLFVMEDFGNRSEDGNNPIKFPDKIKKALDSAQVSFYIAQGKRGELQTFRVPMLKVVDEKGIRHGHMPGFTEEMMSQGMAADYSEIQELSKKVYDLVKYAKMIKVKTKAGTNITAEFSTEYKWVISDGNIQPKAWKNLPDGEVFTAPLSVNGIVIIDGCLGDYFSEKYGDIENTPLKYELENSRAIKESVECSNQELKEDFIKYTFEMDENSNRVGEFAIGTNTYLKKIIGNLLQDEKFPGIHLAMGSPYPEKTGAKWNSDAHLDGVMRNCTIWIDDHKIMESGKYLI